MRIVRSGILQLQIDKIHIKVEVEIHNQRLIKRKKVEMNIKMMIRNMKDKQVSIIHGSVKLIDKNEYSFYFVRHAINPRGGDKDEAYSNEVRKTSRIGIHSHAIPVIGRGRDLGTGR